jgi:hypothetical protein
MTENIILQLHGDDPDAWQKQLIDIFVSLTPAARLKVAIDLIAKSATAGEEAIIRTHAVWTYIELTKLWQHQYSSLAVLKDQLDSAFSIKRTLDQYKVLKHRKQLEINGIIRNWELHPMEALPMEIRPIQLHRDFLCALHRLSKAIGSKQAIPLLHKAIENRKARPYLPKHDYLSLGDINGVIHQLKDNTTGSDMGVENSSIISTEGM